MVSPNCVIFRSTPPDLYPLTNCPLHLNSSHCLNCVPLHLDRAVLNHVKKAPGLRKWGDCIQADSALAILLVIMILQSFTHRSRRSKERKEAPQDQPGVESKHPESPVYYTFAGDHQPQPGRRPSWRCSTSLRPPEDPMDHTNLVLKLAEWEGPSLWQHLSNVSNGEVRRNAGFHWLELAHSAFRVIAWSEFINCMRSQWS